VVNHLSQSDDLHQRVQSFMARPTDDDFACLALDIADFQARAIPAYGRLVRASGARLDDASRIPPVPVEAFRLTRVAAHAVELDRAQFLTSGTTSGARGQHFMRRTDTYRSGAVNWGRRALVPVGTDGVTVLCLAPRPDESQSSSLGFMLKAFVEEFDPFGRSDFARRWFLSESGLDLDGFRAAVERSLEQSRPVLVLATSFALVHLLDALADQPLPSDGRSIVMQTGGFKGKSREIAADVLRRSLAQAFGIDECRVVGEYGMTELSSQHYEGTLPGARVRSLPGWFLPPPWLRVDALNPASQAAVPDGEIGHACFTDLANVDSAVRILTEDRIVRRGNAIQLLGRATTALPRGCSLADEELLAPT